MRKGQRSSSYSEFGEKQREAKVQPPLPSHGWSSAEDSSSDSEVEAECGLKRSRRYDGTLASGEDQQLQANKDGPKETLPKNGVPATELVESDYTGLNKQDCSCETDQPLRAGVFRPQELWLAVTRCLSLRWPPCLSIHRQSSRKLAYQVDLDQSEDTQSSISSESGNGSCKDSSTSEESDLTLAANEEKDVRSRGVKNGPRPDRAVSRSSPRLPRTKQAPLSVLASRCLEKEMFLRIELVDTGEGSGDLRYWAEWKLSERSKELAQGIWLSRSQRLLD